MTTGTRLLQCWGPPCFPCDRMDILPPELHGATRFLWREKRFAALAVFTLALGIGRTAAVFGMADQLLLRPIPGVHDGGRAADLRLNSPAGVGKALTTPEFDELRQSAMLLGGLASHNFPTIDLSVGDVHGGRVHAESIYGDHFEILGVRPAAGRLLPAADARSGSAPMRVVISERLAASLFGSAVGAVGERISLNNHAMTVSGVAGDGFRGSRRDVQVDVWLPMGASASSSGESEEKTFGRSGAPHELLLVQSLLLGILGAVAGVGVGWFVYFLFRGQSLGRNVTVTRPPSSPCSPSARSRRSSGRPTR